MKITTPEIEDELTASSFEKLSSLHSIEESLIDKQEILNLDAKNSEISGSKILQSTATESKLQGLTMQDVSVDSTNLTASKISDAKLTRVVFKNCRLQGVDFNSSTLTDVVFEDCNLDLSNFNMISLRDVIFKGCSLNDVSFISSKQKNVTYENCVIEKIDITDTSAQNVDLSSSEIYGINGMPSLKAFTLDRNQVQSLAPEFATMLGIKIKK